MSLLLKSIEAESQENQRGLNADGFFETAPRGYDLIITHGEGDGMSLYLKFKSFEDAAQAARSLKLGVGPLGKVEVSKNS